MLNQGIVEYMLAIPPEMLVNAAIDRPIQRCAMVGILPESVRTRRYKGNMNAPTMRAVFESWSYWEHRRMQPNSRDSD